MVSSQTGSGKTAAFLLPVLNAMMAGGNNSPIDLHRVIGPAGLVLCPTRELAQQVAQDAIDLLKNSKGIRVATVMGGMPYGKQMAGLRGALLVVATPGRLLDLAQRRQIHLADVKTLVVDEADRMLDLGFAEDLEDINHLCQHRDQTMMFSATFAPRIMSLAARLMKNPGRLELASATDRHTQITQSLHWADNMIHKEKLLDHYLRDAELEQAVVFASTQVETDRLADALAEQGHAVAALHGAMPQKVRAHRLKQLRSGHVRVLVATDVAARGIDVPSITHVFNFGLPMKAEDYVHRIGRTGRAGRNGNAILFVAPREIRMLRTIERATRQPITPLTLPSRQDVTNKRVASFKQKVSEVLAAEGLVLLKPRRGCYVTELSEQDIDEVFPVMALLEGRVAEEAARRITSADFCDGRGVVLSLTPSGSALWRTAMALVEQRNQAILGCLTADEQAQLSTLLDRLISHNQRA